MMIKFRITKEKEKGKDAITRLQNILSFLLSLKAYVKRFDKGGFPLSLKFYIVYALVLDSLYVRK